MPSLNANSGTILILQILTSAFLAILFLQSELIKWRTVAVTLNFFEVISPRVRWLEWFPRS